MDGLWTEARGTAKTVKQPRQQPAQPPILQLLGAADTQTAHPATFSTARGTPTTGLRERGNDTSRSTGRSGMSHRGGGCSRGSITAAEKGLAPPVGPLIRPQPHPPGSAHPAARALGHSRGPGDSVPFVHRTFEWGVVVAPFCPF